MGAFDENALHSDLHGAAELLAHALRLIDDDSAEALADGQAALDAAGLGGGPPLQAQAHLCVAQAHFNLGTLDSALEHVQTAAALWRAMHDRPGESRARALHAQCLQELGQEADALEEALQALRLAEGSGCLKSRAGATMALGYAYRSTGAAPAARAAFREVASLARQLPDHVLQARAICNVANTWGDAGFELQEQEQLPRARRYFRIAFRLYQRALSICRDIGHKRLESIILGNMGLSLADQGRHGEAETLLRELCERAQASGSRQIEEMALRFLGETCLAAGRAKEAVCALEAALSIAEETQRHELAMQSHRALSQAFEQCGDAARALQHHRRYHELYASVQSEASERRARAVAVQLETSKAKAAAEALRRQAQQLEHENRRLAHEASELSQATLHDPLTGLLNRRGLEVLLTGSLCAEHGKCWSLALLDLDHFKQVNDRFSHMVGDEVLRAVGAVLRSCCRDSDVPVRFGGEEFAVVLQDTGAKEASAVCDRIRRAIASHDWLAINPGLAVTASFGVADSSQAQGEALFTLADRRLYAAKHAGRDRVVADG